MTAGAVIGTTLLPLGAAAAAASVACWTDDRASAVVFAVVASAALALTFIIGVAE